MAKNEDEEDNSDAQFPHGIEPVKLESLYILCDLIELSRHQPQTATTAEAKKPAGS
jgi:carboxyl-terminal processing protease